MKNVFVFLALCGVLVLAMVLGSRRELPHALPRNRNIDFPTIGSIQILNGCGVAGAANKVADFLRGRGFDVKNIGNASTSNYPFTLVVSRKKEMTIARQVAAALTTDRVVLMRNGDDIYDATVFIGSDFSERIVHK